MIISQCPDISRVNHETADHRTDHRTVVLGSGQVYDGSPKGSFGSGPDVPEFAMIEDLRMEPWEDITQFLRASSKSGGVAMRRNISNSRMLTLMISCIVVLAVNLGQ